MRGLKRKEKAPEFSRPFETEELEDEPVVKEIEATEEEREALAKRLEILSLNSLKATLTLTRSSGYMITVDGVLKADITQKCVVTLDPIDRQVEEGFDGYFSESTDAISFAKAKREKIVENQDPEAPFLDEEDDPEHVIDGKIDLGELTAQYLSLAIDPYPHKEGVTHDITDDDEKALQKLHKVKNPFAKLETVKKLLEKDKD